MFKVKVLSGADTIRASLRSMPCYYLFLKWGKVVLITDWLLIKACQTLSTMVLAQMPSRSSFALLFWSIRGLCSRVNDHNLATKSYYDSQACYGPLKYVRKYCKKSFCCFSGLQYSGNAVNIFFRENNFAGETAAGVSIHIKSRKNVTLFQKER